MVQVKVGKRVWIMHLKNMFQCNNKAVFCSGLNRLEILNSCFTLEKAAFTAWPALETDSIGPWHLRFANGYTKRANSANAVRYVDQLSAQHLSEIEAFFKSRNYPPIFRLVSFGTGSEIDNTLAGRGYRLQDLTLVMTQPLGQELPKSGHAIELLSVEAWFEAFQSISGKVGEGQATHLKMLQAIPGDCACAVLKKAGKPVCCGLGVLSGSHFGLFDIATMEDFQRRGLAALLCAELLGWGQSRGAGTAYLQVTGHNAGAISVYEKLGFRRSYEYWYRVASDRKQI